MEVEILILYILIGVSNSYFLGWLIIICVYNKLRLCKKGSFYLLNEIYMYASYSYLRDPNILN